MKHLYLWLMAVMVCFGILPAAAQDSESPGGISFTVNVDNADALECIVGPDTLSLNNGKNELTVPLYTSIQFKTKDPWIITNVTDKSGETVQYFNPTKSWGFTVLNDTQDQDYTITVASLDDLRTEQFTLYVDDPSKVEAQMSGYYTTLDLHAGENIIKFQPGIEKDLRISPKSSDYSTPPSPLYSVTVDGEEVAPMYGTTYSIELKNDMKIDVVAVLPDIDCTVTFSYSEGAENSISIKVNGEPVEDFDGTSLTVKLGDKLTIEGNPSEYNYESVKVNGESVYFYSSYDFSVMKDSEVEINAHPYGTVSATISVNAPELITIINNGEALELTQGDNTVELPERSNTITWTVSQDGILKSVIVNGTNTLSSYQNSYNLNEGDTIAFDIAAKVYDQKAIVWVDNVKGKACSDYLGFRSSESTIELKDGYNTVNFYTGMNPFGLSWYGTSEEDPDIRLTGKVYLNDVLQTPEYEGNTSYQLTLANGDVVKLFMDADPVECKVAFDIAEGLETVVVKDEITFVENPAAGFDCFAGTQVVVSGTGLAVAVNGKAVEAVMDETGAESFTFTVTDPETTVAVTAAGGTQEPEVTNYKFTVIVPNADALSCTVNDEERTLIEGENEFDLPDGTNVVIKAVSPWVMTSVKDKDGKDVEGFYETYLYLFSNESTDGEVFTIEVQNTDDLRTSQITINVDDPSLINAMLNGNYTRLELTAGENTVSFDPEKDDHLLIYPATSAPIYSVKVGGVAIDPEGGNSYSILLRNGLEIDVVAILPDEDRTVNFSYSEGAENSISILVNNEAVEDFNGNEVAVKIGSNLTIMGKTSEYKFESITVNGEEMTFYGSYSFSVMKDTQVKINARPWGTISATITVNAPELITIMNNGETLDLQQGANTIELPENSSVITWNVSSLGILNSVIVNGSTSVPSYESRYTLSDGDVIAFDIEAKNFDQQAIVWVDNVEGKACSNMLDLSSPNDRGVNIRLVDGYNFVDFYLGMNPFSLSWNGYTGEDPDPTQSGKVYLNDVLQAPAYEGSSNYNLTLADGDVLKLFMDSDPVLCNVSFDIAEDIEASVVKDIITVVENPAAGFDCFAGTQVVVAGQNLAVAVNGVAVEAEKDEEGAESFTFTVNDEATVVAVNAAGGSGVAGIAADADAPVFNMQGIRVGSKSSLKDLAPGFYIINGRKVAVTK